MDHGNRGTKQNDKPGDVQLIKMPSSLSGHWRIHMETQPWTENTGDQAFMGSAVVGGVHVCARAYMCFLSE